MYGLGDPKGGVGWLGYWPRPMALREGEGPSHLDTSKERRWVSQRRGERVGEVGAPSSLNPYVLSSWKSEHDVNPTTIGGQLLAESPWVKGCAVARGEEGRWEGGNTQRTP